MRQVAIIMLMLTMGYSQKINLNTATLEELQSGQRGPVLSHLQSMMEALLDVPPAL